METTLDTLEATTASEPTATVIWLHGLGADAHDFEPVVPYLSAASGPKIRFVFPNAPVIPVTVNGGMQMRAWYDILGIDIPARQDEPGIRRTEQLVVELIEKEKARGIAPGRIILAGFSQGGAIALHTALRYPEQLGGILALSTYLPIADTVAAERTAVNQAIPILMTHGSHDPVIPVHYAQHSRDKLQQLGYSVEYKVYAMAHEVSLEELQDIKDWLGQVLQ